MAIKTIINNTEKEIEQIKNSDEQDIDYVYSRVGEKEAEGEPTVSIESIGGELKNYRIYGNTVNSESVGDLVTSGEHAGEYCVPVTIEGKNLAKNNYAQSSTWFTVEVVNDFIHVSGTNNTGSVKAYVISRENIFPTGSYDIVNNSNTTIAYDYKDMNDTLVYGFVTANSIKTINFPAVFTRGLNIYKSVPNGESIDNYFQIMVVRHGTDTSTYEPYHAPVTTPIYLPEPIRKVGNEAEYIDYVEQKQHIVRKNLLLYGVKSKTINGVTFRVNNDGSVTCNGTAKNNTWFTLLKNCSIFGECILSGSPFNGSDSRYLIRAYYNNDSVVADYGAGTILNFNNPFTVEIRIASGFTCRNLTFYPMIRKVNIEDDTYEPYIKKTELDIALPALSTVKGTNTFSVNTTIQPSNIYIKDNFDYKRIFTATRAIEGESPLNYKNIEDNNSTLSDYRIYGQTVDGESVGDRTGNLFDGVIEQGTISADGTLRDVSNRVRTKNFTVLDAGTYTIQSSNNVGEILVFIFTYTVDGTFIERLPNDWIALPYSFTLSERAKVKIVFEYTRGEAINPSDVKNIMFNEGSTPLPYEPYGYKVPVTVSNGTDTLTTPIYLPEQIRKVGNEAEYIDYAEQKQHRVRKNLLQNTATSRTTNGVTFTVNNDGSVTCNGTPNSGIYSDLLLSGTLYGENIIIEYDNYIFSCIGTSSALVAIIGNEIREIGRVRGNDVTFDDNVSWVLLRCYGVEEPQTVYPMIRKANIENDTYEQYIENTELDVTLPALPTIAGTNTLSVGTEVQPSKVYLKGKLKRTIYG